MNESRRKILEISAHLFPAFLGHGIRHYAITEGAIPADAAVVNCQMSLDMRTVLLVIESREFPPAADGVPLPRITPWLTEFRQPMLAPSAN